RISESATTGNASPTAPAASTMGPYGGARRPPSRSAGNNVPIAVVVNARPVNQGAPASPAEASSHAALMATAAVTHQPSAAGRIGLPRSRAGSISKPASRNSIARPSSENSDPAAPGTTMASTCGPNRMPSTISSTEPGTGRRGNNAETQ